MAIIGSEKVGKTTLAKAFAKVGENRDVPNGPEEEYEHTHGCELRPISVWEENNENPKICFLAWDTTGKEEYDSVIRMQIRYSSVILIVYDVTRWETFHSIAQTWMPMANVITEDAKRNLQTKPIIFIVGTKSDKLQSLPPMDVEEAYAKTAGVEAHIVLSAFDTQMVRKMLRNIIVPKALKFQTQYEDDARLNIGTKMVKTKSAKCVCS